MLKQFTKVIDTRAYALYRPTYPQEVFQTVLAHIEKANGISKFDLIVDVGCGSGQSTIPYSQHSTKVIGIDESFNQIKEAKEFKSPLNVSFLVANAEKMPFQDRSVDLINCSTAIHWFDLQIFLKECDRVLKPDSFLVITGYIPSAVTVCNGPVGWELTDEIEIKSLKLAQDLYKKLLWDVKSQEIVVDRYESLFSTLPSPNKVRFETSFCIEDKTLDHFITLIQSFDSYQSYVKNLRESFKKSNGSAGADENGNLEEDVLQGFIRNIKELWGVQDVPNNEVRVKMEWQLVYIISPRPQPQSHERKQQNRPYATF